MSRSLDGENPQDDPIHSPPSSKDGDAVKTRLETMAAEIRARLKPDGPDVDYRLLYLYIENSLPLEKKTEVRQRIYSWRDWFDAYWQVRAELDYLNAEGSAEENERG